MAVTTVTNEQETAPTSVGQRLWAMLRGNWLYLLIFGGLLALPFLIGPIAGDGSTPYGIQRGPRFLRAGETYFWMSVVIEIFALSILVMSYNLMFGFTGVISFGHAMFFGLGGYIVGMFLQYTELDPVLAFFVGVAVVTVVTALLGLAIGFVSLRLRGIYFAIFTLAVAEMVWIFFGRLPLTNGEDGFNMSNLPVFIDPVESRLNLYYVALFLFVLTFVFIRRLVNSPTGAVFKAIRDNEERAKAVGFHTLRYKLLSITVAGMMAGGAGIIHALLAKKIGPEMLGVTWTVDALLMTIIGGVGTFTGPVLGAGSLELADTVFRDAEIMIGETAVNIGDSWTLILGLIFILVVLVFPYGVVGTWNQFKARFRR